MKSWLHSQPFLVSLSPQNRRHLRQRHIRAFRQFLLRHAPYGVQDFRVGKAAHSECLSRHAR